MHEDQLRLIIEQVVMDQGHFDSVRSQSLDHRVELTWEQNEVTVNGGIVAIQLEIERSIHAHAAWAASAVAQLQNPYEQIVECGDRIRFRP